MERATRGEAGKFIRNIPETGECVIWPFSCPNGYGYVRFEGRDQPAHRVALALSTGENHTNMQVAHGPCHNRACVNPRHLSWKTCKENHADKQRDGTAQRGECAPNVKLTKAEMMAIRKDCRSQRAIADDYGIAQPTVSKIRLGQRWP